MQTWLIVLLYALTAVVYAVLQQLFFRFRFKDLTFTFSFLTFVSFIVMLSTKFSDLFVWITVVNALMLALIAVYVYLCMRKLRDRVTKQMKQTNMDDLFKNLFSGAPFSGMADIFPGMAKPAEKTEEQPDIIITDESPDESNAHAHEEDLDYYDVGDVIIDEEKKNEDEGNDENKK